MKLIFEVKKVYTVKAYLTNTSRPNWITLKKYYGKMEKKNFEKKKQKKNYGPWLENVIKAFILQMNELTLQHLQYYKINRSEY